MSNVAKGRVLVGIDDPYRSRPSIEAAVAQARMLGVGVTLVHVFVEPIAYEVGPWVAVLAGAVADTRAAVSQLAVQVATDHPEVEVQSAVIVGSAAQTLISLSRQARLIVLDCRGQGGFTELMLGSVSSQVAAYAACPVLVRRPVGEAADDEVKPVVVGVDGSRASQAAVGWAFAEADGRSARLVALNCWVTAWPYSTSDANADAERRRMEDESRLLISEALAGWREKYPDVVVEERSLPVTDIEVTMVHQSWEASMMVVGSRGRGGFSGLLLGSISQALLHHGGCPVLVTRP